MAAGVLTVKRGTAPTAVAKDVYHCEDSVESD